MTLSYAQFKCEEKQELDSNVHLQGYNKRKEVEHRGKENRKKCSKIMLIAKA